MGKKKLRTKYTSKGSMKSMNSNISNAVAATVPVVDKMLNKLDAFNKGKKVMVTIANPDPTQTNKRFIRVPAATLWGDPKTRNYIMPGTGEAKTKKKAK